MKGDFSRQTFKQDKHYNGVLMQQGRVQLDADWNEQQAINRHRAESQAADLVGPAGAPKSRPGFGITPRGNGLQIGAGHFYVDGLLCENDEDVPYSAQEDVRLVTGNLLPVPAGLYIAYIEAWDRHISALEDSEVRETALGGPDTAARSKAVWQVKLLPVADPGGSVTCNTTFAEWDQLLRSRLVGIPNAGKMAAQSRTVVPSNDPLCILPPNAGYRRLENQLYRVEVHRGGTREVARFKWSRDNGTVVSAIEPDDNGNVASGSQIIVAEIGKDTLLTLASEPLPQWLELTDDRYELTDQRGTLVRVQGVDPATRTVTFVPGPLPDLDPARHPLVRRWDQRGGRAPEVEPTDQGVPMTGNWQSLEDGVEVRFADGAYSAGDYWLIPARTAIGADTGSVEWPKDSGNPTLRWPDGTPHHLARLALVRFGGASFTAVPNGDCRPLFPPLTAITAEDVSISDATCRFGTATTVQEAIDILCSRNGSLCNLLVGPGEDLAAALGRLGPNPAGGRLDALICLRPGTYTLQAPLRIQGLGHIQVLGVGPGTRIEAPNSEAALEFVDCLSVSVRHLSVSAGAPGGGGSLNGSLTFLDCPSVTVDGASVTCAGGPQRAASCITIRNTQTEDTTSANVHTCNLEVGHRQVGVLLVNVGRSHVTDNVIQAGARPPDDLLLKDVDYRAALRRQLIDHVSFGGTMVPPPPGTNATVTYNGQEVHFRSDPGLSHGDRNDTDWSRAITTLTPAGITSPRALKRWLKAFASAMLLSGGTGTGGTPLFRKVIPTLLREDTPAADQGIVVGGLSASEVLVSGNTVIDAVQGIHVGFGRGRTRGMAGVVMIKDNNLSVSLPTSATRERFGVFVGNCNSLVIDGNFAILYRNSPNASLRIEGMRVFGTIGKRVIIRHNHMAAASSVAAAFTIGVTFAPLEPLPAQPLWIITENLMESSATKVDVPSDNGYDPVAVSSKTLGFNVNFA